MKTKQTGIMPPPTHSVEVITLTEQHLSEWLELLDKLRDAHAPTDELTFCRNQVTRLQRDLYQLRNN